MKRRRRDDTQRTLQPALYEGEHSAMKHLVNTTSLVEQFRLLQSQPSQADINYITQVQAGFKFRKEPEDEQFFFLHVEPLLDQAADLLDRGLAQRASWDALAAQMTEQWFDLNKFAEEDKVRAAEEAAGIHDLPSAEATADATAERVNVEEQSSLSEQAKRLVSNYYSGAVINRELDAIRKGAFLSGVAAYEYKGQTFAGYTEHFYKAADNTVTTGRVQDFALQSAEAIGRRSLLLQKDETTVRGRAFQAAAKVSAARLAGLEAREQYSAKASQFSKNRIEIDRNNFELRIKAATAPDGALNYSRRLVGIRERFTQDFRDGLARLKAIQPGLKAIYGFDLSLPSDESSIDFFDKCLLETRRALQWLIRFSRFDQTVVVPISIRRTVGEIDWRNGLEAGEWEFDVSREHFCGLQLVRMRGLTAFAEFESNDGLASIQVVIPRIGYMFYDQRIPVRLDQSRLPPCHLFRVQERQSIRDSDVVGVAVLHNASPIGIWKVKLKSSTQKPIKDIFIDVLVNYRSGFSA